MSIPQLPKRLGDVTIPKYLSPSRFLEIQQCPLKVFVNVDSLPMTLAPSPKSLLGLLLHHVREQLLAGRWGKKCNPIEAFEYIFESSKEQMDSYLESDTRTLNISSLEQIIGRSKWNASKFEMMQWANHLYITPTGEMPKILPPIFSNSNVLIEEKNLASIEFGPEAWIVCPFLRLRGRVDLIKEAADGVLEILDYKSGTLFNHKGKPSKRYEVQLKLYALAAENLLPERKCRLYLEGSEPYQITWNEKAKLECAERLNQVLNKYQDAAVYTAQELGRPGIWCRGCIIRPVCPAYLEIVPEWWLNTGQVPRPLPFDVWGTIQKLWFDDRGVALELVDRVGRSVNVMGLDSIKRTLDVKPGDDIYLFDLQPTEPRALHGTQVHPRNFHEIPPDGGLIYKIAHSLQIYQN